ncbi:MAG: (Fe-S)-binding protein [Oceanococcaceae bacterium]
MKPPFPHALADLCVKCGLCLPHCPTYRSDQLESEGPRGRIAILQALAREEIEPTPTARSHLEHCLGCASCEAVCPAKVPYLELRDHGRAAALSRGRRFFLWLLSHPGLALLRSRATAFLQALPRPLQPKPMRSWPKPAPGGSWPQGKAAAESPVLFRGCQNDAWGRAAQAAAARLLLRIDPGADTRPAPACCGALPQHEGALDMAASYRQALQADPRPLVALDSGCLGDLRRSGREAHELCRWLLQHWPADWQPAPLPMTVALHLPCTHRNVAGDTRAVMELLGRIPELRLETLQGLGCCGAGGLHAWDAPDHAAGFARALLDQASPGTRTLLSTNLGCRLHLGAHASEWTVLHPVELLERALMSARA